MPKTEELNGIEGPGVGAPPRIKAIEVKVDLFQKAQDKRKKAKEAEGIAKDALIDEVHKHADKLGCADPEMLLYQYDDIEVVLSSKDSIKVRMAGGEDSGD